MKKTPVVVAIFCASFFITGCNEKNVEPVQTVDWFKEHKAERDAMLEKCRNNPGELEETPNCINAGRAESSITWSSKGRGLKLDPKGLTADEIRKK